MGGRAQGTQGLMKVSKRKAPSFDHLTGPEHKEPGDHGTKVLPVTHFPPSLPPSRLYHGRIYKGIWQVGKEAREVKDQVLL